METLWKSLRSGIESGYDRSKWAIGEWRKGKPPTQECVGFNASENILDAMTYVPMEVLAEVEVDGGIIKGSGKWTCEKMRITKAWEWTKEESVRLSIFSAELVLKNFEDVYPDDDRPRKAIEAAKHYLEHPNGSSARSARSAESAAESAWSARSAASAWSAWSAASAWSARSAAESARSAAASARSARSAESAALQEIENYIQSRIPHLKALK